MANEPTTTIVGNLVQDPDLRFLGSGVAVVNLNIASTPRNFDRQSNEWKDGETLFIRGSLFRDYAEHVAESLSKGQSVIATGRLKQRNWEQDGQKRSSIELEIEEIGPALRYATATVTKKTRGGSGSPTSTRQAADNFAGFASSVGDEPF